MKNRPECYGHYDSQSVVINERGCDDCYYETDCYRNGSCDMGVSKLCHICGKKVCYDDNYCSSCGAILRIVK